MSPLATDLAAIRALTRRDLLRFSRDRSQLLGAVGRPAIWMLLFATGLHHAFTGLDARLGYRQFAYAGAIAMTILFGGMFQGVTIVWDREFGMLRAVLVAPVSRTAIVVGKTMAGACVTMLQGLVAAAFAPLVDVHFGPLDAVRLALAMATMSLAVTALGVTVGSRMRTFEGFGVISNFVVLPLYFLSGGVFPPEGLPRWMRALVMANPVSYGVDLMRAAIEQPHAFSVVLDVGVQAAFTTAMCVAALAAFRRAAG
ncbi:MAG TPA: ABC transporter permease [Polyangiaceae bacterium]